MKWTWERPKDLGLNPIFLPYLLKGLDFIKNILEARAEGFDFMLFSDDSIDMILCAIGGDILTATPYLLKMTNYKRLSNQKFSWFLDTSMNHPVICKPGNQDFTANHFLADISELDKE